MALEIINVGSSPDDGSGDPLRTAYIKCNNNFAQVFARAQPSPPPSPIGLPGDVAGMYAYDSTYFYYCYANYDGSSQIWAQVTQIGNISVEQITNGTSNVAIMDEDGPITVGVAGVGNIGIFSSTGLDVAGQINSTGPMSALAYSTTGYLQATGNVTGGNLRTAGSITATGGITGGNLRTTGTISAVGGITSAGTITASYFVGDGSGLTNLPGGGGGGGSGTSIANGFSSVTIPVTSGNIHVDVGLVSDLAIFSQQGITVLGTVSATGLQGPLTTNSQPNITSVGTLTGLTATGNISTLGYFIGDGSLLTNVGGGGNYGNADVAAYLVSYTGNIAAGNLTVTNNANANIFYGNAASITYINTTTVNGNLNGNVTGDLVGNTTGIHTGLVGSIDILELSWDFGTITGTITNPIQWLINTIGGGFDAGTVLVPNATNIDIGVLT